LRKQRVTIPPSGFAAKKRLINSSALNGLESFRAFFFAGFYHPALNQAFDQIVTKASVKDRNYSGVRF
jgi:hypothetical protein